MDGNDSTVSRAGSRWLIFMGSILAIAGAAFTALLWHAWQRAEVTRSWMEVPCKIISAQLVSEQPSRNSPTVFRVRVRYDYEMNGRRYEGHRIRRVDGPTSDHEKAEDLREQYAPGQQITCWVNPQDPEFAILRHDSRAALYSIWFPLLFVLGGGRMAWAAWRVGR